jgi:hypothetical protein
MLLRSKLLLFFILLPVLSKATEVTILPRYTSGDFAISWGSVAPDEVELQERYGISGSSWSRIYKGRGTSISRRKSSDGTWSYRARRCIAPEPGFPGHCEGWGGVKLVGVEKSPGQPVMGSNKNDLDGNYRVSWSAASGTVTKYVLYERADNGHWERARGDRVDDSAMDVSGKPDGVYDYKAKACNHVGCGAWSSSTQTVTVLRRPGKPGPIQKSRSSEHGNVRLTWGAATGRVDYYSIYRRKVGENCPDNNAEWCEVQQTTEAGYIANYDNGEYQFKVKACNTSCGPYTDILDLTVTVPKPALALNYRSIRIPKVGAVGETEDGLSYTTDLARSVIVKAKQGDQCRDMIAVSDRGRFLGESKNCNTLRINMDANSKIHLYAANGLSSTNTPAQCDVYANDVALGSMYCGWRYIGLKNITRHDVLQMVHLPPEDFLPPESMAHSAARIIGKLFWIGDDKQAPFTKNQYAGGGAKRTMQLYGDADEVVLLVGLESSRALSIPVQFFKNDYLVNDTDDDDLGNSLESEILLCNGVETTTVDGFDCTELADTKDTDGDGLLDTWELLGRRHTSLGFDQPLAYWGAYPRHKDLFLEINYVRKVNADPAVKTVEPDAARHAHAYWSFSGNAYRPVVTDPVRIQDNAEDLKNPDREPGIALHLDTGRFPRAITDWTIYGNWGGYKVHHPTNCRTDSNGNEECNFVKTDSRYSLMQDIRYGIFKVDLVYHTNGGQAPWGLAIAHGVNADYARVSELLTHEGGHSLGLDHSSPYQVQAHGYPEYTRDDNGLNCDALYFSLMNYTYESRTSADLRKAVNGKASYMPHTFSDGHLANKRPFHMQALREYGAVDYYLKNPIPSVKEYALNMLRTQKHLIVDGQTGSVDWNRDGVIQGLDETARAGVNYLGTNDLKAGLCEAARMGRSDLGAGIFARQSLSSESYNDVLQIVWVDSDRKANKDWNISC